MEIKQNLFQQREIGFLYCFFFLHNYACTDAKAIMPTLHTTRAACTCSHLGGMQRCLLLFTSSSPRWHRLLPVIQWRGGMKIIIIKCFSYHFLGHVLTAVENDMALQPVSCFC
jgi:hypothetical protein